MQASGPKALNVLEAMSSQADFLNIGRDIGDSWRVGIMSVPTGRQYGVMKGPVFPEFPDHAPDLVCFLRFSSTVH